jgi:hypothetical protein
MAGFRDACKEISIVSWQLTCKNHLNSKFTLSDMLHLPQHLAQNQFPASSHSLKSTMLPCTSRTPSTWGWLQNQIDFAFLKIWGGWLKTWSSAI